MEGVLKCLVGLEMLECGIVCYGYFVLSDGKVVGEVISGIKFFILGKVIVLVYIFKKLVKVG